MLYIVPSRGRPHNIIELVEAWEATRTHAKLWICTDDNDPKVEQYQALKLPPWATLWQQERLRLGPTLNFYALRYLKLVQERTTIGFMGDDHRPRTYGWDTQFSSVAATGPAVIYGNDLIQGANLPTSVCITDDIIRTLGYMVPPGAIHLFLDNMWRTIGTQLGALKYVPEVVIEHVHPVAQKAQWDAGYVEVNSQEVWDSDEKTYNFWLAQSGQYAGWKHRLTRLKAEQNG